MSRDDSKMMQGVAILMMIFFHLFTPSLVPEYKGTLIGAWAQVQNPVPLYTLLSGYGLYCVYSRGTKDKHRFTRCLRLYERYWLITGIFLIISIIAFRGGYSWKDILLNIPCFKTDIYPAAWFVLPYCILAFVYLWIFKVVDRIGSIVSLLVAYIVYAAMSFCIGHIGGIFGSNILQVFYILFPFVLGAVMAKTKSMERASDITKRLPCYVPWLILALWLIVRFYISTGAFAAIYAMGLTIIIVCMRRPMWFNKILLALGHQSVGMWFIHGWIFWKLGRDIVYGLKNPLLIMFFVTIVSFLLAYLFDKLYSLIKNILNLALHDTR